jgi:hypothetical protein
MMMIMELLKILEMIHKDLITMKFKNKITMQQGKVFKKHKTLKINFIIRSF